MGALNTVPRLVGVICALILVGCSRTTECDPYVGVCPRPQVGVVVNDAGFVKSIWLEEPEVTPRARWYEKAVCRGDVDVAQGDEIFFEGENAFVVVAVDPDSPRIISRVPLRLSGTSLIDVEGDGNVEYVERDSAGAIRLRNHAGDVVWEVTSDLDDPPVQWSMNVFWLDFDGDGFLEFLVSTDHGVELRAADGAVLGIIGTLPYRFMRLGQFDEDPDFELVAQQAPYQDESARIDTYDLDGTLLGSFVPLDERASTYDPSIFFLAADPTVPELDRIEYDCRIYDPVGNEVGTLEKDEYGLCRTGHEIIGWETTSTECKNGISPEMATEPFGVRFNGENAAYRVELTYSFERYDWWDPVFAGSQHNIKRTILRIYDAVGDLAYHEVLGPKSGPGSFAVIPSEVESAEVLLLADDSTVFAYSLPAATP